VRSRSGRSAAAASRRAAIAARTRGRSGIASRRDCCADARELLRAARVFRNTLACSHTERRLRRGMRDKVDAREATAGGGPRKVL
jgi:hypothetical protein